MVASTVPITLLVSHTFEQPNHSFTYRRMNILSSRRPKRKAAEAALNAIHRVKQQEAAASLEEQYDAPEDVAAGGGNQSTACVLGGEMHFPEDVFLCVLGFLSKPDLVHRVSLVSKAWLHSSKSPLLWPALDKKIWKTFPHRRDGRPPVKTLFSMKRFLEFLRCPQFASLKTWVPPDMYRTESRRVFDEIAKACPNLEQLDLSGTCSSRHYALVPVPCEAFRLPTLFPKMTKISLCTRHLSRDDVTCFLKLMGQRLVELQLFVGYDNLHSVGGCNCLLDVIARSCPNLESFRYGLRENALQDTDTVTNKGVIAVLRGCPKLRTLELVATKQIGNKTFEYIVENTTALCRVRLHSLFLNRDVLCRLRCKIEDVETHECILLTHYDRDSSDEESGVDSVEEPGVDSGDESDDDSGDEFGGVV